MIDYMTRTEWALFGFTGGVLFTLIAVGFAAAVIMPDVVLKARRRRRSAP